MLVASAAWVIKLVWETARMSVSLRVCGISQGAVA